MAGTITWKTKGKAKERLKDALPPGTKEETYLPSTYLVHTYLPSSHQGPFLHSNH
jgi:hypothetical protein